LLYPWGKTLNAVSHLGATQSTRCGGPAWRKTCKQNSFCVVVVWQTQSIGQHLIQTKKIYLFSAILVVVFMIKLKSISILLICCVKTTTRKFCWFVDNNKKASYFLFKHDKKTQESKMFKQNRFHPDEWMSR